MQLKSTCLIFGAALVLAAGCKKAQNPSDVLKPNTASYGADVLTGFPAVNSSQRLIAYDNGDGSGLNKIFSYDLSTNKVDLIQVVGGSVTNVFTETSGIPLDNGTSLSVSQFGAASDDFNEVGGLHITAFDANNSGHMSYLLLYVPGQGRSAILEVSPTTPNTWHMIWPTNGGTTLATGGFNGYDLMGATDKVLAYGISGTSNKPDLIFYRPGNAIFWLFQNTNYSTGINYNAVAKSSSGVAGYDLKGATDQIAVVGSFPIDAAFRWDLIAYRPGPGLGFFWYITHSNGTANFAAAFSSHSGIPGYPLTGQQDRIIPYDVQSTGLATSMLGYIPGSAQSSQELLINFDPSSNQMSSATYTTTFGYQLASSPYAGGAPFEGDKIFAIHGNAGLSTLVCYANGKDVGEIWETNPPGAIGPNGYTYQEIF